ncbi:hypothetical protein [Cellulomonas fengjieae]|uniref:Uncharacterized protein n=1 Tax=Cellulomonas fengjieae TaxID=2819978 RepID=A0ABS3SCD5_9CELL|nr:hypothetical protein [Cellulomonas fengjieae]MBO3083408.1 hypothetical protein [Cellulomonas fengjieae]QVI65254.1 hypothetical protein KG102_14175 [Cellulomonas fengjieae]
MSTADPHRPRGATDRPDPVPTSDESHPSIEETTPAGDDSPAHEVAPTVETLDPPSTTSATPTTTPSTAQTSAPTAEPGLDTGRHAVVRPAPTPPDEPVAPARSVDEPADPPAEPAARQAAPTETVAPAPDPVTTASEPTTTKPAAEDDAHLFPDPNAPRRATFGSHVLGVLVGLILAPVGAGVLLLGESRILEAQVGGWDASTEVLGIVLVTLGLLLLGCVLLLGLWTPAVPITGGGLLTLAGIVYLYLPSVARDQTLDLLTSSGWRVTVTQVTVAGTSGMALAVGFLLLLSGIVTAVARRRGVRLGEFRERHRA